MHFDRRRFDGGVESVEFCRTVNLWTAFSPLACTNWRTGNTLQRKARSDTPRASAIARPSWLPFPHPRSVSLRTARSRQWRAFRRSVPLTASTVRHNRSKGKGSLVPLPVSVTYAPGSKCYLCARFVQSRGAGAFACQSLVRQTEGHRTRSGTLHSQR